MRQGPGRHRLRLWVGALPLLAFTACRFGAPPGGTEQGRRIANLYHLLFYAAIPIAAIVYGLILWSVIRYRRRRGDGMPSQFRYHIPLELVYTVIPVMLVIGLFVATYSAEKPVDRLSANPAVTVNVTAFQWQWRFRYPQYGIDMVGSPTHQPTMVLPAGRTVEIRLVAADVDHAFFVPDFLFKRDAIPGFPNRFDFDIPRAGLFHGECAEFCGLDHADMTFWIRAVSPARFRQWVSNQGPGGAG